VNVWAHTALLDRVRRRQGRSLYNPDSARVSSRTLQEIQHQLDVLGRCICVATRHAPTACIYVLVQRSGHGFIKIGRTKDLLGRTGSHQSNAFGEIALLAAFHGDVTTEKQLHAQFSAERVWGHREHFHASRRLLRWVDDVCRLNGRDDDYCWSCRHLIVTDKVEDPRLKYVLETVDTRCSETCFAEYAWYDVNTRKILRCFDSTGRLTAAPAVMARWLFEEEDLRVPISGAWARLHERGTNDHTAVLALRELHTRFHHRQTIFFPPGEELPDTPLPAALRWASNMFRRYGVVSMCGCDAYGEELAANRVAMEKLNTFIKERR